MTKNNQNKNLITVFIALFVMLALIIGVNYGLKPVRENSIMKQDIKKYSSIVNNISKLENAEYETGTSVSDKKVAYDASNVKIGTLFTGHEENQYGSISIIVAVNDQGIILGIEATNVDQSIKASETKTYINALKGSLITNPQASNITAPTVAISLGTAEEILADIAGEVGIIVEEDVYKDIFGEGYELVDKAIDVNEVVIKAREIKVANELKGTVYTVERTGEYNEGDTGEISFDIILGLNNEILGYEEVSYKHTPGFKKRVLAYLDLLISNKVEISKVKDFEAERTGSTNSIRELDLMLEELTAFLGGN